MTKPEKQLEEAAAPSRATFRVTLEWRRHARLIILLLSLLAVTGLRLHSYTEPLEGDEATYMLMAKVWQDGGRPYDTLWDNKPIGTFIIYRVGLELFGYHEGTPRLLALGAMLLATLLLARILWREKLAVVITGMLVLWPMFTVLVPCYANGTNIELLLLPFIFSAYLCLRRYVELGDERCWAAAAAVLAISLLLKQVTLPLFLALFLVLGKTRLRNVRQMLLRGAALGAGIVLLHLLVYGVCGFGPADLLSQLRQNAAYCSGPAGSANPVWRLMTGLLGFTFDKAIRHLLPLTLLGLAAWGIGFYRRDPRRWLWLGFYAGSVLAIVLPGANFPHYYILALPVILLSFMAFYQLSPNRVWRVAVPGLAFLWLGLWTTTHYLSKKPEQISNLKFHGWFPRDRWIGLQLRKRGISGRRLFVDGTHPSIYFYSRNRPATRCHVAYPYISMKVTTPGEVMAELKASPPDSLALLTPEQIKPILPGFAAWRQANYRLVTEIAGARIYARKQATPQN